MHGFYDFILNLKIIFELVLIILSLLGFWTYLFLLMFEELVVFAKNFNSRYGKLEPDLDQKPKLYILGAKIRYSICIGLAYLYSFKN